MGPDGSTTVLRMIGLTRKQVLGTLAVLVVLAGASVVVVKARSLEEAPQQQISTQGIELAGCPTPSRYGTAPTAVAGTVQTYRLTAVPDNHAYDLRSARVVGFPESSRYPLLFGKNRPGRSTCVVGGTVEGQQSRDLTWQTMKRVFDGDGLSIKSTAGVVDGIRIDNVQDGIGTIGGDPGGITIRNVYMTYIRDDCLENDAIVQVTLRDSLLDGCYSAISERPGAGTTPPLPPPTETTTLDGVLIRLQPMPFNKERATCPRNAADGLGHSGFFKWSRYANRLVVKDTVLLAERNSVNCGSSLNLPRSGSYDNVKLVWLGPGKYPGRVPGSGVTVTSDRGVWDRARAEWLTRHGYPTT
jgi:hypothetical protein